MARTITYYYPDESNPSSMKIFQDRSTQIRGFYFKRDYFKRIADEENAKNYAVYFLFGSDEESELPTIYVGQSRNGAERFIDHNQKKAFWTHCIMFVSDNSVFDANVIDYVEYYFIQKVKNSGAYSLDNKDLRTNEPNLSIFDKITYEQYINQIEFLLNAEGIVFALAEKQKDKKYYEARGDYKAKVYFQDGKFILEKGSVITKLKCGGEYYKLRHQSIDNLISQYLENGKIEELEEKDIFKTLVPLSFNTISTIGVLVRGRSTNGWDFFNGIDELRKE